MTKEIQKKKKAVELAAAMCQNIVDNISWQDQATFLKFIKDKPEKAKELVKTLLVMDSLPCDGPNPKPDRFLDAATLLAYQIVSMQQSETSTPAKK